MKNIAVNARFRNYYEINNLKKYYVRFSNNKQNRAILS